MKSCEVHVPTNGDVTFATASGITTPLRPQFECCLGMLSQAKRRWFTDGATLARVCLRKRGDSRACEEEGELLRQYHDLEYSHRAIVVLKVQESHVRWSNVDVIALHCHVCLLCVVIIPFQQADFLMDVPIISRLRINT